MKYARWQQERTILPFQSTARSTGPTVIFMTVVPPVDRPVDRDWIQRATALYRSTGTGYREQQLSVGRPAGRPGPFPESRALWPVDRPVDRGQIQRAKLSGRSTGPVDRPSSQMVVHVCAHRSTGPVYQFLSRSTGRKPGQTFSGIKTWSFYL